jgi:hypothetical protein
MKKIFSRLEKYQADISKNNEEIQLANILL